MEGSFHQLLKQVALSELEKEGFELYVEPLGPPLERLDWSFYRPDILGFICSQATLSLVLVECETYPTVRRVKEKISKIRHSFVFQKRLNEKHLLRLLLVIPPGALHRVSNWRVRRLWEIWIVNRAGRIVHRIPQLEN